METVFLRKIEERDKDLLFSWISNPSLRKMTGTRGMPNAKSHDVWFNNKINDKDNVIRVIQFGARSVGIIGTNSIDLQNRNAEIYLYVGDDQNRKRGIGASAVKQFMSCLFDNYGIHKIFCRIFSYNIASIRLFQKLGFKEEGRLKDHVYCLDEGKYYDLLFFGCFKSDYDEKTINDSRC